MNRKKILIVEDEPKIRDGLTDFFNFHDYQITEAVDGLQAKNEVEKNRFDLIILDLMLPHISGEELCKKWRQTGLTTPVIMLTAKGAQPQKIEGLNLGADDYVTKPFSLEELLARVKAVLRRVDPSQSVTQSFKFGNIEVNLASLTVNNGKKTIPISKHQAELIKFFAANPNRVIDRKELYEKVWQDQMVDIETRTVDMHIAKLRGKIEKDPSRPEIIKTVRGAGYIYEK
jgi:DNA-binding response OmpR family regulator